MSWKFELDLKECRFVSLSLSEIADGRFRRYDIISFARDLKERIDDHLARHKDLERSTDDRDFQEGSG